MRGALKAGFGAAMAGLVVAFVPATGGAAPAACKATAVPADESVLTSLIAAQRKAAKAPRVATDVVLSKAGRQKSLQMARGGKFAHESGMAWAQGRSGAQNIAMAPSAGQAFQAMMQSPPHRRNIMDSDWRLTGVGAARDCTGQTFYTVNFAGPA